MFTTSRGETIETKVFSIYSVLENCGCFLLIDTPSGVRKDFLNRPYMCRKSRSAEKSLMNFRDFDALKMKESDNKNILFSHSNE